MRVIPITEIVADIECFLHLWEAFDHLVKLLSKVSPRLDQQVFKLHLFCPLLLLFLVFLIVRYVSFAARVKQTVNFLPLDVVEFKFIVTIALVSLDLRVTLFDVQNELLKGILVLEDLFKEVEAADAPQFARH